jgi:hypothetical protein
MTTSAIRHNKRITTWIKLSPFKCFNIKHMKIIKGLSFIVDTSVSSKNIDSSSSTIFWLIKSSGMVSSRFWSTDFRFSILWISS